MLAGTNNVREKVRAGQPAFGIVCRTLSPVAVELIGLTGFDFVWLDMEHATADFGKVEELCRAADVTEMTTLVRVPDRSPSHVLRVLEAGAGIVNVPQVETADQAVAVVSAAKYAPIGKRGYSSSSRGTRYGVGGTPLEVFAEANRRTMTMVQIESVRGVENAAEICAVPGLDVVFVGLGDLSQSMDRTGQFDDPGLLANVHNVLTLIKDSGKIAAMHAESVEGAKRWITQGVKILSCAVDISVMRGGLERIASSFGPLRN